MIWWIIIGSLALLALRFLMRKRRHARKLRKAARRRARQHHGYSRTVRGRGRTGPEAVCSDCGEPKGKCRRLTRRAEHPEGFLGELKD
jgi:hypothetical protein